MIVEQIRGSAEYAYKLDAVEFSRSSRQAHFRPVLFSARLLSFIFFNSSAELLPYVFKLYTPK